MGSEPDTAVSDREQTADLVAPFPWFGGKRRVADLVWPRFGSVVNYVEPFAGSLAMLLSRPQSFDGIETVNDLDGFVANFWRALAADPAGVAHWADWPVNENDQHARHIWLVQRKDALARRLEGDPMYYDVQIAGWWVWGISVWIGGGWCSGNGPWHIDDATGQLVHLGNAGQGVHRKLVHLGNAGKGVHQHHEGLLAWMQALAVRLRRVRVCCGDWSRVCGPTPTVAQGLTAVFLDPPYSAEAGRDMDLYRMDDGDVAHAVRDWALAHGDDPRLRIALCGYAGELVMPETWTEVAWKAQGGYSGLGNGPGRENAARERIWFSPHCHQPVLPLFEGLDSEAEEPIVDVDEC